MTVERLAGGLGGGWWMLALKLERLQNLILNDEYTY